MQLETSWVTRQQKCRPTQCSLIILLSAAAAMGCAGTAIFMPLFLIAASSGSSGSAPPPPSPPPLKMVLMTDWHVDPHYSTHLGPECRCNNVTVGVCSTTLSTKASRFGTMGCNVPEPLFAASLEAAVAALPDPDLVIILGDFVAHRSSSRAFTQAVFDNTSRAISAAFVTKPRACAAPLGNNDMFPNYGVNNSDDAFYSAHAATAREYCGLDDATAAHFARVGYYNLSLPTHSLTILVLNTNVYAPRNCANGGTGMADPACGEDPLGQFAWMDAQLRAAAAAGHRVQVHGHIPPAVDSFGREPAWHPDYIPRYWQILEAHAPLIAGHFFGHWHEAIVRASSAPALRDAPALQVLGAVSPIYDNNPVFYSATFDPVSLEVASFTQHVLVLATVGEFPNFVASARVAPPTGLSNADYLALIASWLTPEGDAAFQAFFAQWKAGYHGRGLACDTVDARFAQCATCTGACRVAFACLNSHGKMNEEYAACLERNLHHL